MCYFAVCDANGPVSVELGGATEAAAVASFQDGDRRGWSDAKRADLDAEIGIASGAMDGEVFDELLVMAGAVRVRDLDAVEPGWDLWHVQRPLRRFAEVQIRLEGGVDRPHWIIWKGQTIAERLGGMARRRPAILCVDADGRYVAAVRRHGGWIDARAFETREWVGDGLAGIRGRLDAALAGDA